MRSLILWCCSIVIGLVLSFSESAAAQIQHTITISARTTKPLAVGDTIFIAGNFNNWDPAATPLKYNANDSSWRATIHSTAAAVQYKYTRGNWSKVEALAKGEDISNRSILPSQARWDTVIAWKDSFEQKVKTHTASKNVHLLSASFFMPQLKAERGIWMYLPPDYKTSAKRYPVIYMQDGQNIFDDATSGYGEWGVDEILDSLYAEGVASCIVVGIESGKQRMNEYNPFKHYAYGDGLGENYISFIANTLKPFIDSAYRTLPSASNTIIAGSSMGGLIAYYAAITKPQIFGKVGIFSPSFWIAPALGDVTDSIGNKVHGKFFFSIGKMEGAKYVSEMEDIMDKLAVSSTAMSYSIVAEEGQHNERAWRQVFPIFYRWIMASGANVILETPD